MPSLGSWQDWACTNSLITARYFEASAVPLSYSAQKLWQYLPWYTLPRLPALTITESPALFMSWVSEEYISRAREVVVVAG